MYSRTLPGNKQGRDVKRPADRQPLRLVCHQAPCRRAFSPPPEKTGEGGLCLCELVCVQNVRKEDQRPAARQGCTLNAAARLDLGYIRKRPSDLFP